MNKIIKSLKKLSANCITCLILSLIMLLFIQLVPFQIGRNITDSLPQKFFLILKGKLPQRNYYVAFKNEKTNQFYKEGFIKQVIGISGDEIKELNNNFWIASKEKPFIAAAGKTKEYSLNGKKLTEISTGIIPPNYYYVYAPDRDSLDSRYEDIGLIHESEIIGIAKPISLKSFINFCGYVIFIFLSIRIIIPVFINKKAIAVILFILPLNAFAKDLGVHGKIYNIIETDLSQNIKNKLSKLEESGELEKLQKQWQKQAIARAERPKAVTGLSRATSTKEFIYDPSITSNKNIYDHQGNIIVKKGTKVNPLHYQSLPARMLFINGDDKSQVRWALEKTRQNSSIIILTQGNVMQLMRDNKTRIYFDQNGYLVKTFNIKYLPTEIYQEKDILKVREVAI